MTAELDRARRAFAEELRGELAALAPSMPPLPLPHDVEAERELLGMVLRSEQSVSRLGLLANRFYAPLHRDLWAATDYTRRNFPSAERPVFLSRVALAMEATEKYSPATVVSELEWLEEYPATRSPAALVRAIEEAHKARSICDWLRRIDEDLRLGRIDSKKAIERLGKAAK